MRLHYTSDCSNPFLPWENAWRFRYPLTCSTFGGNLYALPSQGSMAFKLPSFGLLERTKKSSPFADFPQFSWSDVTDKEEIGRGSFGCVFTAKTSDGESVVVKKLLRQHERERRSFLKFRLVWFGFVGLVLLVWFCWFRFADYSRPKLSCYTPHRRSTVSLETYPFILFQYKLLQMAIVHDRYLSRQLTRLNFSVAMYSLRNNQPREKSPSRKPRKAWIRKVFVYRHFTIINIFCYYCNALNYPTWHSLLTT